MRTSLTRSREDPIRHSVNATLMSREEKSSSGIRGINMMKTTINRYRASVFCFSLLLSFGLAVDAQAQAPAEAHVAAAQAAVAPKVKNPLRPFDTFKALFDQMCTPP